MMLGDYLSKDVVRLNVAADGWESAVRIAGELLVDTDKCSPEYVEAMVRTVKELGPYMVIAPGLALAHARPEDGTLEIGLSLVTLKEPVDFGSASNDPVKVVISFCAVNKEDHIGMLKELAGFLRLEDNLVLLKQVENVEELLLAVARHENQ